MNSGHGPAQGGCLCVGLQSVKVVVGHLECKGLRCPRCIDAIIEEKNRLVRENQRILRGEFTDDELQGFCHNLSEENEVAFKAGCVAYQARLFPYSRSPNGGNNEPYRHDLPGGS